MNENKIWDCLLRQIGNPYGVAGLMGNLYAESALNPKNLQNSYEKSLGMTDDQYTAAVDDGSYANFVNDGAGYGLAQWTYSTRKAALLSFAQAWGLSIGDLDMQLAFLIDEMQADFWSVFNTLCNARSVRESSDAVLLKYEKPKNQSVENQEKRAALGQDFFDRYGTRNKLTIYLRLFRNANCYKKGQRITPSGVQVHSTGANNPWLHRYVQPDDGRIGGNAYNNDHNRPGLKTCAHAYIGRQTDGTVAVYQALPWNMCCWLSANGSKGNANKLGYLGFEVCEDGLADAVYFQRAVQEQAAMLTAYLCQKYAIDPDAMVRDHKELHGMGLASNHGDVAHWLKNFGYTMDDFRAWVKAYMEKGVEAEYIDCDEGGNKLYQAKATCSGSYLNLRAEKSTESASIERIMKGDTVDVLNDSDPDWWRVQYNGETGYAMRKYLMPISTESEETAPDEPGPQDSDVPTGPAGEPLTPESAAVDDPGPLPRAKLQEMRACLADCLSIVNQALGLEG